MRKKWIKEKILAVLLSVLLTGNSGYVSFAQAEPVALEEKMNDIEPGEMEQIVETDDIEGTEEESVILEEEWEETEQEDVLNSDRIEPEVDESQIDMDTETLLEEQASVPEKSQTGMDQENISEQEKTEQEEMDQENSSEQENTEQENSLETEELLSMKLDEEIQVASETEENEIFALLYANGTMVFQKGKEENPSYGEVVAGPFSNLEEVPWRKDADKIKKILFKDTVSPSSTREWFVNCSSLENIEGAEKLDTSHVTDMTQMFLGCRKLSYVDISSWDVRRVTSTQRMFAYCTGMKGIDLSGWKLLRCRDMSNMFDSCGAETIDLSGVQTPSLSTIAYMFINCSNLEEIVGIESMDVSYVKDMSAVFQADKKLQKLNLNSWNTENVTSMYSMFTACSSLQTLDLCNWKVNQVTNFAGIFSFCAGLKYLNLSGWDVTGCPVSGLNKMFYLAMALESLNLSSWKVADAREIMSIMRVTDCSAMQFLNVDQWDLTKCYSLYGTFQGCHMRKISIQGWDTSHITSMESAFQYCYNLNSLDLSEWNTEHVTSMRKMFFNSSQLSSLNISNFQMEHVTDSNEMLKGCTKLNALNICKNNAEKEQYQQANASQLRKLSQVTIDGISGTPDFLFELLAEGEVWCSEDGRMILHPGDIPEKQITVYRMKRTQEEPLPSPDPEEKEQKTIRLQIQTWKNGRKIEREYDLGIYDSEGNCIAHGNSADSFTGRFETGERYTIELEAAYEKNCFVEISGEEFLFQGEKNYDIKIVYKSKTNLTAKKIWKDDDAYEDRPEQLVVILYRDGEPFDKKTLSEENQWTYEWPELQRYAEDGHEYIWKIEEEVPPGYTESYTHVETEKEDIFPYINVKIVKDWIDDLNVYGLRIPITFRLWKEINGQKEELDSRTYEWNDENHYVAGWYNLPKFDENQCPILYSVTEDPIPFYETQSTYVFSGDNLSYTFVNQHQEFREIKITKKWIGDMEKHSDFVQTVLYGAEEAIPVKLTGDPYKEVWDTVIIKVPKYKKNGEIIRYTLRELALNPQYHDTVLGNMEEGFLLLNEFHRIDQMQTILLEKIWHDDLADESRPYIAHLILGYFNESGKWIEVKQWETSRNESHEFYLPQYDSNGERISYYVIERPILKDGQLLYSSNAAEPIPIQEGKMKIENYPYLEIRKEWDDSDNTDGIRPDSVEVDFYKNGEYDHTCVLDKENQWTQRMNPLPLEENGEKIIWKVVERKVPEGYYSKVFFENSLIRVVNVRCRAECKIRKNWKDENDADGIRPDFVEVELYANEKLYGTYRITEADGWEYLLQDLPYSVENKPIQYSMKEKNVPEGYRSSVSGEMKKIGPYDYSYQVTITNTHMVEPAPPSYHIKKIWDDQNNAKGYRPEFIEVELLADGACVQQYRLSEENNWEIFLESESLPERNQNGEKISYSVAEKHVPLHYEASYASYTSSTEEGNVYHMDITNGLSEKMADIQWEIENTPQYVNLGVKKVWDVTETYDLAGKPVYVQLYRRIVTAENKETGEYGPEEKVGTIVELNEDNHWEYCWKKQREYRNGYPVIYSVDEVNAEGDRMTPDQFVKTVSEDSQSRTFYVVNASTKVEIEKRDLEGKQIPGAVLQILDSTGNVVEEWTTKQGMPYLLEARLDPGTSYILHEAAPPEGYGVSEDIPFMVETDGKVQKICMTDAKSAVLPMTGGKGKPKSSSCFLLFTLFLAGMAYICEEKRKRTNIR